MEFAYGPQHTIVTLLLLGLVTMATICHHDDVQTGTSVGALLGFPVGRRCLTRTPPGKSSRAFRAPVNDVTVARVTDEYRNHYTASWLINRLEYTSVRFIPAAKLRRE